MTMLHTPIILTGRAVLLETSNYHVSYYHDAKAYDPPGSPVKGIFGLMARGGRSQHLKASWQKDRKIGKPASTADDNQRIEKYLVLFRPIQKQPCWPIVASVNSGLGRDNINGIFFIFAFLDIREWTLSENGIGLVNSAHTLILHRRIYTHFPQFQEAVA